MNSSQFEGAMISSVAGGLILSFYNFWITMLWLYNYKSVGIVKVLEIGWNVN